MATGQMSVVIQHLRKAMLLQDGAGLTDGNCWKTTSAVVPGRLLRLLCSGTEQWCVASVAVSSATTMMAMTRARTP